MIYRSLLEKLDLTYTQYIVLMALWETNNISITELARRTGLSKATMTPLLKRMEKKQLIERQQLEGNERQKNIMLTDLGSNLSTEAEKVADQAFAATGLSEKQAQKLIKLCQMITA
jgi:DNA-binding MarR family transcriptional regulator